MPEVITNMILLTIIYLAFISLGLPDAILGAVWPNMSQDIGASLEYAGAISVVINAGTVISSLLAARLIHRFGTGKVVAISVLLTACALLGFAWANYLLVMALLAVPLGLGAGAVDAALNNFVALHYKSNHMNYLHSFWGVGATAGPFIMASFLLNSEGWRDGYLVLATLQFLLVVALFLSLPLWKKAAQTQSANQENGSATKMVSNRDALKIKGMKYQLFLFWFYCSLEAGTGLWAASYLTSEKGVIASDAAFWTAMYYFGITAGRFLCGIISERIGEARLVHGGGIMILLGVAGLLAPIPLMFNQLSLVLIGLGCAPVYPNTLHLTPTRFGKDASQAIIGLSMATAYVGTTLVPPFIGALVGVFSFSIFPVILLMLSMGLLVMTMRLQGHKRANHPLSCHTTEAI